ncbi:hypothetical protein GCM10027047_32510 [Rhodococcus aerolatus]
MSTTTTAQPQPAGADLPDAEARARIAGDTAATLFVEAGAGSGKTSSLVARLRRLVLADGVPLTSIAAVTFTEKAGAELRDRLRAELETVGADEPGADAAARALDDLDGAAIGTLHSFAQRILAEHPVAARLPPLVEVADELSSAVAFEERWSTTRRALLDDPALTDALDLAMAAGVTLENLRSLAKLFNADWDLVADRVLVGDPPAAARLTGLDDLVSRAAGLAARAAGCTDPEDKFLPSLLAFGDWGRALGAATDDRTRVALLLHAATLRTSWGKQGSWGGKDALAAIKDDCAALKADAAEALQRVLDAALRVLSRWVAARVHADAQARRDEGRLEFHDLLVLSRDLLRHDGQVRAALAHRYPRLLLDEFQDTDPIQVELAVRIAGGAAATQADWADVVVPPGSLFVVGDPKQSIYRFRRADVAMYLRAQDVLGGARGGGEQVSLTTCFRTVAPVVDWVNGVFGRLITHEVDAQPAYAALTAHRPADPRPPAPGVPGVTVLGAEGHPDKPVAAELRTREAADVAAVVHRAVTEGWPVQDRRTGRWRPAELDDVAVLVPARTSLPYLEEAFDAARVPYRAESSSLVYQAQEVRDLLAAARAVADPSDQLSLVTALRSPLFGCGDDDLWTWRRDGGTFSVLARAPDPAADPDRAAHPVARGLAALRALHHESRWWPPSEVLGALVERRRVLETHADGPRARDAWRRTRFVVDQARAWSESEHGGLRAYLVWAAQQGQEASRVAEASLPETDARAVRIMTVHAAKGLEFPIVVLSGTTAAPQNRGGVRVLWPREGGYAVSLRKGVTTGDFAAAAPVDEQMDERERRRLLYVATTRARDHLVVSLHRAAGSTRRTSAFLLAGEGRAADGATAWETTGAGVLPDAGAAPPAPLPDWTTWSEAMQRVREATRRTWAVSASGLEGTEPAVAQAERDGAPTEPGAGPGAEAGRAKGGVDVELPAWTKGRYGTAIGRAVHAVLQAVDLASGEGLDDAVGAQSIAEGVTEHAGVVADLVRSALGSELVARAAARRHWREMYVGAVQDDGTVLEGYVDLVYAEDDGSLVVVDYKTDAVPSAALGARAAFYAPQLRAYAGLLAASTGYAVAPAQLLFLHPGGPARAVPVAVGQG